MKKRYGFVSNSSTSSYIIPIEKLKRSEIKYIYNHVKLAKNDRWLIEDRGDYLYVYTFMDNFDMYSYLMKGNIKNFKKGDF